MNSTQTLLAAYLAAWWFWIGIALGGLANVWLHNLTGGRWGEAIRAPLLNAARTVPLACLLFLPVLVGVHVLYPWASGEGLQHLAEELSAPAFKVLWLSVPFFIARSVAYLLLWSALAWVSLHPSRQRSRAWSSFALLAYGFSIGLASVDWIMSLLPQWHSSVFGWLIGTGQMMAGMCLAILLVPKQSAHAEPNPFPDLGNLLLMYVMTWTYLAFVQFLIIWAENLPHEIVWYEQRRSPAWLIAAWTIVALIFILPLLILLWRRAKRHAVLMKVTAGMVLAGHALECWWMIFPSIQTSTRHALWMAPALMVAFGLLACLAWKYVTRMARKPAGAAHG